MSLVNGLLNLLQALYFIYVSQEKCSKIGCYWYLEERFLCIYSYEKITLCDKFYTSSTVKFYKWHWKLIAYFLTSKDVYRKWYVKKVISVKVVAKTVFDIFKFEVVDFMRSNYTKIIVKILLSLQIFPELNCARMSY